MEFDNQGKYGITWTFNNNIEKDRLKQALIKNGYNSGGGWWEMSNGTITSKLIPLIKINQILAEVKDGI